MNRDKDLLRSLMIEIVDDPNSKKDFYFFFDDEKDDLRREYHLDLLIEVAFLNLKSELVQQQGRGGTAIRHRIVRRGVSVSATSSGHDYVDAIRDEGIWAKTKTAVAQNGGNATIAIMRDLAVGFLRKQISDRTGIQL